MDVLFLRQAHRFIKKADPHLKEKIKQEVLRIKENPTLGETLSGNFKGLRSHHFSFTRTQYRIAYDVKDNILIIAIASRENFYRDLERNI